MSFGSSVFFIFATIVATFLIFNPSFFVKNWLLIFAFLLAADLVFGQWKLSLLAGTGISISESSKKWTRFAYSFDGIQFFQERLNSEKIHPNLNFQFGLRLTSTKHENHGLFAELTMEKVGASRTANTDFVMLNADGSYSDFVQYNKITRRDLSFLSSSIVVGYRKKLSQKHSFWYEGGTFFQGVAANFSKSKSKFKGYYEFNEATNTFIKLAKPVVSDGKSEDLSLAPSLGLHLAFGKKIGGRFSLLFRLKRGWFLGGITDSSHLTTFELSGILDEFDK